MFRKNLIPLLLCLTFIFNLSPALANAPTDEQIVNPYNYSCTKSIEERMAIAQRLLQQNPQNPTALNFMLSYYRGQGDRAKVESLCQQLLAPNTSAELKIIAYTQLGSMYFYDMDNSALAKTYVDRGIELTRRTYTEVTIDSRVNSTGVSVIDLALDGISNPIRELYVLQNILEEMPPSFASETTVASLEVCSDKIHQINFRTDLHPDLPTPMNLTDNKVTVLGTGISATGSITSGADAKQAALLDAYREIFEAVIGITPQDIGDKIITQQHVSIPVSLRHKIKIVKTRLIPGGGAEVTIEGDMTALGNANLDTLH